MIQRIQSVYLFAVAVLMCIAPFLPLGTFISADQLALQTLQPIGGTGGTLAWMSTWNVGLAILQLLVAILAIVTIFSYRKRKRQMHLTAGSMLLLTAYYVAAILPISTACNELNASFHISWSLCLPAIAIILDYLAYKAIRHDDLLVKAADRLR